MSVEHAVVFLLDYIRKIETAVLTKVCPYEEVTDSAVFADLV